MEYQLERDAFRMMKSYVACERMGDKQNLIEWSKPLNQTKSHMEESNIEKAQILMKEYQRHLKKNKELYPELRWPDLRLTISDHQQEWGNLTPTSG